MREYLPIKDPVLIFAVVAALILFSPIVLRRWQLPGMIGLLIAGAILGPNALGVLARDQSFVLFGTVGLLYIMFMAALEIDLASFKRYRVNSVVFGLFSFAIPLVVGFFVSRRLWGFNLSASILLGSVLASHTLLAYPVASRLGITKGQAVTTAVGGTILTDTFALLTLAVVAGSTAGDLNPAFWYRMGLSMSVYVLGILFGLPLVARWFFRRVARDGVSEFVFVLAVVFGCASLSRAAGVEPIVGAFLSGLALNRLIPHSSTLMSRIRFTGEAVFIPFFLLSVGMLLDVRVFAGGARTWIIAGSMLVSVVATKWLAAELMRLVLGYKRDEARVIFGLTIAQAAATLASTMVGYKIGLFDEAVVNGAIVMILGTCILAPIVTDKYGRSLAQTIDVESDEPSGRPQRVIVALGKPTGAHPLIELAQLIRDPAQDQPIYPLTVVEEGQRATEEVAQAERMLSKAVLQLAAADVAASPLTRIDFNVPAGVLRARRELRATEVIVGWAARTSTSEFFFGSMLEKLLNDPYYTLVLSRLVEPLNTCRRVLFAVPPNSDQEPSFPQAARVVKRLARQLGAKLIVLSVKSHTDRAKKRIASVKPSVEFSERPLENWAGLTQSLADAIGDGDLLILCGTRSGNRTWRASPGELPEKLARRFPNTGLLVIHPAEPQEDANGSVESSDAKQQTEPRLDLDPLVMNLNSKSPTTAVVSLLREVPGLATIDDTSPLVQKLVGDAEELAPGVVLIHAETPFAAAPAVGVGVSAEGVVWRSDVSPAFVLVLILDPPGRDAIRHLQNLANVARTFRGTDVVSRARLAENESELRALLLQEQKPSIPPGSKAPNATPS